MGLRRTAALLFACRALRRSGPALFVLCAVTSSVALAQRQATVPKAPPTAQKIAEWKKEAEARALFQAETPLELKLVYDRAQ